MIIWRGNGFLVIVTIFLTSLVANLITNAVLWVFVLEYKRLAVRQCVTRRRWLDLDIGSRTRQAAAAGIDRRGNQ